MKIEFTLKNYRCFSQTRPARIVLQDGITALVGPNNAGKSSLLRFFYEFRHLFAQLADRPDILVQMLAGSRFGYNMMGIANPSEPFCNDNGNDLELQFRFAREDYPHVLDEEIPDLLRIIVHRDTNNASASLKVDGVDAVLPGRFAQHGTRFVWDNCRYLELAPLFDAFRKLSNTLYVGPFRNALGIPGSPTYFDIPVGREFVKQWGELKNGDEPASRRKMIAVTDEIMAIFGFTRLEINATPSGEELMLVLSNGRSHKLPELGSGLTQFILTLGTAAVRAPEFILIDEPELNLHPSLQLSFLTTLAGFAKSGVLFSTHSLGLARSAADRTYAFRRKNNDEPPEVRPLDNTPRLSEWLGELSFGGYQELGFEKVLLVEGATEIKTVQQILRSFGKDHEVMVMSLGGADMINGRREVELAELTRISPHLFALIDSERASAGAVLDPARDAFLKTCANLNITAKATDLRATENYFPDRAVKAAFGAGAAAIAPYEKFVASPHWAKAGNWKIAHEMTRTEIEGSDFGTFIKLMAES